MIDLKNVTLFCISSDNVDGALRALQYSMRGINYGAVKLITHKKPDNLPPVSYTHLTLPTILRV